MKRVISAGHSWVGPTGSNRAIQLRPRLPNIRKVSPDGENRKLLSPISAKTASLRFCLAMTVAGRRRETLGRAQQLDDAESEREHGGAEESAERSRRLGVECELPPQIPNR